VRPRTRIDQFTSPRTTGGDIEHRGGPGASVAEACEKEALSSKTHAVNNKRLDQFLPLAMVRRNPVDMAGPSTSDIPAIANLLSILIEDRNNRRHIPHWPPRDEQVPSRNVWVLTRKGSRPSGSRNGKTSN